jgi:hypothetical protein
VIGPIQKLRREIGTMLTEDVDPTVGQVGESIEAQREDETTPEIGELALIEMDVDVDLHDLGPDILKGTNRLLDDGGHLGLHGIDTEVR